MAWMLRSYIDICWAAEGGGGVTIVPGGGYSNIPGYGPPPGAPGVAPNAQTLRLQQGEQIIGITGSPPSAGNIQTALNNMATDANSQVTATLLAQIQNWQTGAP